MKQSIEKIWEEGFVDGEALIAPKINDLYNKKSQNIVDKLKRMFEINVNAIVIGAFAIWLILTFMGAPILGGVIGTMLFSLVVMGNKQLKTLDEIDKSLSSYDYIKAFDGWMKDIMAFYTKMYSFLYPMAFIAVMTQLRFTEDGSRVLSDIVSHIPEQFVLGGVPWFILLAVVVIAGLLSYFAGPIYRADFNIIYGNSMKKLDEIIEELEVLRK